MWLTGIVCQHERPCVRHLFKFCCNKIICMTPRKQHEDELTFSSSARRDFRAWGMFVVGAVIVFAALNVDPQKNCSSDGECAPWLVPIAFIMAH